MDGEKDMSKSKGGKARAEKLSPEQRTEIAKKAAEARWQDSPKADQSATGRGSMLREHNTFELKALNIQARAQVRANSWATQSLNSEQDELVGGGQRLSVQVPAGFTVDQASKTFVPSPKPNAPAPMVRARAACSPGPPRAPVSGRTPRRACGAAGR